MKYSQRIVLACMASLCWNMSSLAGNTASALPEDEKTDKNTATITIDEDELPEGMTQHEIDSLLNNWTVRQHLGTEETCDPSSVNPDFPREVYIDRLARMQTVVEMPYNDIVRSYIDRYTQRMRRSVSVMLGACNFYVPTFEEALESYQVPLELKYLPIIESALNPEATSRAGAAGLWQFMIGTGKRYGLEVTSLVDERRDPIKSSYAAAHYFKELYQIFGNWTLCIAAYNCGPGNVNKAIKRAGGDKDFWAIYPYLPKETRGYVPAYIAATYIMNYYCDHNICPAETRLPAATDTIMVNRQLHLNQVAMATGLELDEIKALNPQYRTSVIPGHAHACSLRLPMDAINSFLEAGDSVYEYRADEYFPNRREILMNERGQVINKPASTGNQPENGAETLLASEDNQTATTAQPTRKGSSSSKRSSSSSKKTVKVKPGDTLGAIAARNHTTVSAIKRANGLRGDMIHPGQSLRIK